MKFRKKPVIINAIQLIKSKQDLKLALEFMKQEVDISSTIKSDRFDDYFHLCIEAGGVKINTLEGTMLANWGDWIIEGINGEFYPCKPDIFEKTYELVE